MGKRFRGGSLAAVLLVGAVALGVGVPVYDEVLVRARVAQAQAEIYQMHAGMLVYERVAGSRPTSPVFVPELNSFDAGVQFTLSPLTSPVPYLGSIPRQDPFEGPARAGVPIAYQYFLTDNNTEYGIVSIGPSLRWPGLQQGAFDPFRPYDPTNGLRSEGTLFAHSLSGLAPVAWPE